MIVGNRKLVHGSGALHPQTFVKPRSVAAAQSECVKANPSSDVLGPRPSVSERQGHDPVRVPGQDIDRHGELLSLVLEPHDIAAIDLQSSRGGRTDQSRIVQVNLVTGSGSS